jgi:neopullulanase
VPVGTNEREMTRRLLLALVLTGCPTANPIIPDKDAGTEMGDDTGFTIFDSGTTEGTDTGVADTGEIVDTGTVDTGVENPRERSCMTTVRFRPTRPVTSVFVAGTFNAWSATANALSDPDFDGTWTAELDLEPGLYPYKFVVDGNWELDASHLYRAYDQSVENSGLRVFDCSEPLLESVSQSLVLNGASRGSARFVVRYIDSNGGPGPDPNGFEAMLKSSDGSSSIQWNFDSTSWELTVDITGLSDDKYTLAIRGKNLDGTPSNQLLYPFWVEEEAFDWRDAIIYMVMPDRFRDGDVSNNAPPTQGATPTADFEGGDLQGLAQTIEEGYFDAMGIKALWIAPVNTNPQGAYEDGDGTHFVTGYHGYWPAEPRQVDPRFGGDQALSNLMNAAHRHGIRILTDFVINHVHEEHPYVAQHPEWFHTLPNGCLCGADGCDWTGRRLDCLFRPYMPDIDWFNNDASETFISDAMWWLETFDLDGLRVDAVKHVPDGAIFNLGTQVAEKLETAGTNYFLVGETAMGWSDCDPMDPNCNANDYGTISRYIGPNALDGQFDFVLYHSSALSVWGFDSRGMIHASVWTEASTYRYPQGAIMTPYISSHDTPRYVSQVNYPNLAGNKWPEQQLSPVPDDPVAYDRLVLAMTWNLTIPGAPLMYYGDEYGEYGSHDPDNRHMMRFDASRTAIERTTYDRISRVAQARALSPALRRGDLETLLVNETTWVYARNIAGTDVAIVALNKQPAMTTQTVDLPTSLFLTPGTVLEDQLSGQTVTIGSNNDVTLTMDGYSGMILLPQ